MRSRAAASSSLDAACPDRPPRAHDPAARRPAVQRAAASLQSPRRTTREAPVATTTRGPTRSRPARLPRRSTRCSTTRSARSATPCASSCASASCPRSATGSSRGSCRARSSQELAKLGLFGMHLDGYGLPGASAVGVRPHVPRARGRRLRRPQRRLRAGLARDVRDLALGIGGAEGALAAADAPRRGDRLLRPHRAGRRLRPGHDAHPRAPRRLRLDPQRREDVDHERDDRRRRGRVGADGRRRDPRASSSRRGTPGFSAPGDPQEDLAPRVGHVGARAPGRPRPRATRCFPAPRRCAARSRA